MGDHTLVRPDRNTVYGTFAASEPFSLIIEAFVADRPTCLLPGIVSLSSRLSRVSCKPGPGAA